MAHDFPNSPSVGDTTTANGITYRWDGSSWNIVTESVRNVVDTMSGSAIDYNAGTYHVLDLDSDTTSATLTVSNLPSTSEKHTLQVNFAEPISAYSTDSFFTTSNQSSSPTEMFIKPDGSKMYILDNGNDTIFQYTLNTPWFSGDAVYDNSSFVTSTQENFPTGFFFKPDGTKLYVIGGTNRTVYQYSLSTAWDISTVTYDSASFNVVSQIAQQPTLFFKDDGSKLYILDNVDDDIHQYTLSTPWDITSASYDSVFFDVTTQESTVFGMFIGNSGTKLYVIGYGSDAVQQYTLSTAWDLSSASYDSVSFSVSSQDTNARGVHFDVTGKLMYIVGDQYNKIFIYKLETPWDVSTASLIQPASYDNISFSVSSQESGPTSIKFKPDGSKMYILGYSNENVYQYSLSTEWDVSTASYDSAFYNASTEDTSARGMYFKPDGTKMYMCGVSTDSVYQYSLSTPWDISTISYDSVSFSISSQTSGPYEVIFKPDGTKMYVLDSSDNDIHQYSLSSAWDISTASYDSVLFSAPNNVYGFDITNDGTKIFLLPSTPQYVYQSILATPWDLSSATPVDVNKYLNVYSQETIPYALVLGDNDSKLYVVGAAGSTVYRYSLSTYTQPYSITWPSEFEFNENTAPLYGTAGSLILELYNSDNTTIYATEKFNNI